MARLQTHLTDLCYAMPGNTTPCYVMHPKLQCRLFQNNSRWTSPRTNWEIPQCPQRGPVLIVDIANWLDWYHWQSLIRLWREVFRGADPIGMQITPTNLSEYRMSPIQGNHRPLPLVYSRAPLYKIGQQAQLIFRSTPTPVYRLLRDHPTNTEPVTNWIM